MSYYQVSPENMQKVESYFVRKIKENGTDRFEATVVEIADGAGVALATAHNAIKQMIAQRIVQVIKPSSRRFPITYIYKKDIEDFEVARTKDEQVEYLTNLVRELTEKNDELLRHCNRLEGEKRVLENKLSVYN